MPVIEIGALNAPAPDKLDELPARVAQALADALGWNPQRFTIYVQESCPSRFFAEGQPGQQLPQGFCLIRITCAGGKTRQEEQTIILTVQETVTQVLGIAKEHVAVLFQQLPPGGLYVGGQFL